MALTRKMVASEILMCGVKFGIKQIPIVGEAAVQLVEGLHKRHEALSNANQMAAFESQLSRIEKRMRDTVEAEIRTILTNLGRPSLPGEELTREMIELQQIREQGWAPHFFEGLLRNSSHWSELRRNPQHYGRILRTDEPVNPENGIHLLIDKESIRILEMPVSSLAFLLANQPVGIPSAEVLTQHDIWAIPSAHNLVPQTKITSEPIRTEPAPKPRPTRPQEPTANELVSKTTGMKFVTIPAGSFRMGSSPEEVKAYLKADPELKREWFADEQPQHLVQMTKTFAMGVYPVTQGEYAKIMGTNPSRFAIIDGEETSRFPVESVSWFDAIEFCNKFSEKDGFSPVYNMTHIERDSGSIQAATVSIAAGNGYRLPTEAEWEYACRAGSTTPFHFGDVLNGDRANIDGNYPFGTTAKGRYLERTSPVGSYVDSGNKFGLFDMHGNVWEWCFDHYDANAYKNRKETTNNHVVVVPSEYRVLRGGSWSLNAWSARSAYRFWFAPVNRYYDIGFRVVR